MKKLMIPFALTATLIGSTVYAVDNAKVDTKDAIKQYQSKQTGANKAATEVKLYAENNDSSKVLAKIDVSQNLVPFFSKGGWIKVGDPANGQVGWINKGRYREAMNDAIHQSVQTVYIEQTKVNGKKPEITVYQNGQKLSGKKADEIYERVNKQQAQMQEHFARFQKRMNQWANAQMQMMNNPMMGFSMMPMMQPIVIVENNPGKPAKLAPPQTVKPELKE